MYESKYKYGLISAFYSINMVKNYKNVYKMFLNNTYIVFFLWKNDHGMSIFK